MITERRYWGLKYLIMLVGERERKIKKKKRKNAVQCDINFKLKQATISNMFNA